MIRYTAEAERQIGELQRHYEALGRLEALRNLDRALDMAEARITRSPGAGLPAPRPYPSLTRPGRFWIKEARYWIAYSQNDPPTIQAIFFETADIPGRATD